MKGVLMGACVLKKNVQIFFCFVINIYDCVLTAQLGAHLDNNNNIIIIIIIIIIN
jgi:hypothetical protein